MIEKSTNSLVLNKLQILFLDYYQAEQIIIEQNIVNLMIIHKMNQSVGEVEFHNASSRNNQIYSKPEQRRAHGIYHHGNHGL